MRFFTPERFMRAIGQTPILLDVLLNGITQERALAAIDDGEWSVLHVVCHLRDSAEFNFKRARQITGEDRPAWIGYDEKALAAERNYAGQDLAQEFASFLETRREFLKWLKERPESDWQRVAIHPESGEVPLLEVVANLAMHEVNHLQQIARLLCLTTEDTDGFADS